MGKDLAAMDAVAVVAAFQSGDLSPTVYAEALVERALANSELNALASFDEDYVIRTAQNAFDYKPNGALAGLPVLAKDNINTTNYPTSGGTGALQGHTPANNAPVIDIVMEQGGFIAAKAGLHELAMGITSNNGVTGSVRNPVDPTRIAGGSSGGTSSAVGAGIFPLGLGTDTGGSCRVPASLCGTIGFRPTTGRYTEGGVIPISSTRDVVGPFARSVRDIALMDGVLAGEATTLDAAELSDIRLGIPRAMFFENLDPEVASAMTAQLDTLAAKGAKLIEVEFSSEIWAHNEAFSFPVVLYEIMRELPEYLKEHAPEVTFEDLIAGIGSPDVAAIMGSQLGDEAMPEAAYRAAIDHHRPAMRRLYSRTFEENKLDAIVFPTTPMIARPIGEDETVKLNGQQVPTFPSFIRNTDLGSNLGVPGISLPCPVGDALPVGLALDGVAGADRALLAVAGAVSSAMKS